MQQSGRPANHGSWLQLGGSRELRRGLDARGRSQFRLAENYRQRRVAAVIARGRSTRSAGISLRVCRAAVLPWRHIVRRRHGGGRRANHYADVRKQVCGVGNGGDVARVCACGAYGPGCPDGGGLGLRRDPQSDARKHCPAGWPAIGGAGRDPESAPLLGGRGRVGR